MAAERLGRLWELLIERTCTVPWYGPDAEALRERARGVAEAGGDLLGVLRELREELHVHAAEQDAASVPDGPLRGDPLRWVRAGLLTNAAQVAETAAEWIGWPPDGNLGPWIGGRPFAADPQLIRRAADVTRKAFDLLHRRSDDLPGLGDPGPWIGGPFRAPLQPGHSTMPVPPWRTGTPAPPLPEGEQFALREEHLNTAAFVREKAMAMHPIGLALRGAMAAHEGAGALLDSAAPWAEVHPVVGGVLGAAGIVHDVSSLVVGEGSTLGLASRGIDQSLANTLQTGEEVTGALRDLDGAGVARALERGAYRRAEASAILLTASPFWGVPDAGVSMLEHAAEVAEPIAPQAVARHRHLIEEIGRAHADLSEAIGEAGRAESWYEARRRHVPMPWDVAV